jgi:hypothetical protein
MQPKVDFSYCPSLFFSKGVIKIMPIPEIGLKPLKTLDLLDFEWGIFVTSCRNYSHNEKKKEPFPQWQTALVLSESVADF